jgi:hypothetical protein
MDNPVLWVVVGVVGFFSFCSCFASADEVRAVVEGLAGGGASADRSLTRLRCLLR